MDNSKIIIEALRILNKVYSNVFYIVGDVRRDYLLFLECDKQEDKEEQLNKIGVYYVAKYECYGIEREFLWDNRNSI